MSQKVIHRPTVMKELDKLWDNIDSSREKFDEYMGPLIKCIQDRETCHIVSGPESACIYRGGRKQAVFHTDNVNAIVRVMGAFGFRISEIQIVEDVEEFPVQLSDFEFKIEKKDGNGKDQVKAESGAAALERAAPSRDK